MKWTKLIVMILLLCVSGVAASGWRAAGPRHPGKLQAQTAPPKLQAQPHVQGQARFQGQRHIQGPHRHAHRRHHLHRHRHIGHHRRSGSLVQFGFSTGPTWGPYPRYYAPFAIERIAPPVYIERTDLASDARLPSGYWYYCHSVQAYWPEAKRCPEGWERVPPRPQQPEMESW